MSFSQGRNRRRSSAHLPGPKRGVTDAFPEDLFVLPAYRGKGYRKAMLKKLAQITTERGCGCPEWACLDWNKPRINLYLSLGVSPLDNWTTYRLAGKTLKEMAR